ncbi:7963_t:CDS:2 [Funneliformis geosporum]|nr:7963_t:CDS:2 [Funneliformis geosporum]
MQDLVKRREISRFINEAVEEKLQKQEQETWQKKQQEKETLRKQLIAGYKENAKNKKLQKELKIWDETVDETLNHIDQKELKNDSNSQNEFDERIIVVPFTTDKLESIKLVEVCIKNVRETGLDEPSKVQLNYPFNVDKELQIIIIKTDSGQKVKNLLDREHINYQIVYDDILADKKMSEEEIYRRDMRLANQDKDRQKEIELWDKIQNQDNTKLKNNDDND